MKRSIRSPKDPALRTLLPGAGLYTDLYELTMAQGYLLSGRAQIRACFDYFFRDLPFEGGYVVFAGLGDVLSLLEGLSFEAEQLDYLGSLGFGRTFLEYLGAFRFEGDIHSVREGEIIFPYEPAVRVEARLSEGQLVETLLLNLLNYESLVATKASRLRLAAGDRQIADFGLRRAQGLGGLQAARAAVIGGVDSSSNVYACHLYGLEASGTQAHSWIQAFGDELQAFRTFAQHYPDRCVLLVDTYDTLKSGIPNAIRTAREMEARGQRLAGVRLDSGDLAYLSKKSRAMLDEAGLHHVKIAASNQLDEHLIRSLIQQGAPIDLFGVGTRLVTGGDTPALDGVYKLSQVGETPSLKVSEDVEKVNFPGLKRIVRYLEADDTFYADGVLLAGESQADRIFHPFSSEKSVAISDFRAQEIQVPVMRGGRVVSKMPAVNECARYCRERLERLQEEYRRFENPHRYKVGISRKLMDLRDSLLKSRNYDA